MGRGHRRGLPVRDLLVFDMGGTRFSATVIRAEGDELKVVATNGATLPGGADFDRPAARWIVERFSELVPDVPIDDPMTLQRVVDAVEAAKADLSSLTEVRVNVPCVATRGSGGPPVDLDVPMTRDQLESLVAEEVKRAVDETRKLLETTGTDPTQLEDIILVGGQACAPALRTALEALVGRPIGSEVEPPWAVVTGAAVAGWALRQVTPSRPEPERTATSLPIGIETAGSSLSQVFDRGAPMPGERAYGLKVGPEGLLRIAVFQGESTLSFENRYLGGLIVRAPPESSVEVSFLLGREGLLTIAAKTPRGGTALTVATADATEQARQELFEATPLPCDWRESVNAKRLLART